MTEHPQDPTDAATLLQAYVDDELAAEEAALVARLLDESPSARAVVQLQQESRQALQRLPREHAPAGLRARILAGLDAIDCGAAGAMSADPSHATTLGRDAAADRSERRRASPPWIDLDAVPPIPLPRAATTAPPTPSAVVAINKVSGRRHGHLARLRGLGQGALMAGPALAASIALFLFAGQLGVAARPTPASAHDASRVVGTRADLADASTSTASLPSAERFAGVRLDAPLPDARAAGVELVSSHTGSATSAIVEYLDARDGRRILDVQRPAWAGEVASGGREILIDGGLIAHLREDRGLLVLDVRMGDVQHSLRTRRVRGEEDAATDALIQLARLLVAPAQAGAADRPAQ